MSDSFYEDLEPIRLFEQVVDAGHYVPVPDDWGVVITDVKGSTKAIEAGRYRDVNALGVASIVAVVNAVAPLSIPYVFGGDGATLLVPLSKRPEVERALRGARTTGEAAFGLSLRVGLIPVADVYAEDAPIRIAKQAINDNLFLAMLQGSGVALAEQWLKDGSDRYEVKDGDSFADYEGFECRWEPIKSRHGAMISLLIQAFGDESTQAEIYREALESIGNIAHDARPAASSNLELAPGPFQAEDQIKNGPNGGGLNSLKRRLLTAIGRLSMRSGLTLFGFDGRRYRDEVVRNTDFRKFDEMLRMVLDVTEEQQRQIEAKLLQLEENGKLVYGIHVAPSALMTCVVRDHDKDHLHFVDGSDGGYALAAKRLKKRLKERNEP